MTERNGNGKNGLIWKTLLAVAALAVTVALTLTASGDSWGRQSEKVAQLEARAAEQQIKIECHEKEIATLKAHWEHISRQLNEQQATLTKILDRLPSR